MNTTEKPIADAALVLKKAKELAILFNKELNNDIITQASDAMWNSYEFESGTTVTDAMEMLFLEQHPESVLFENSATKFIAKNENEHWKIIKQVGKETMLGDFRDFIDTLIAKHGPHAGFYLDSDRGDEYLVLKLKKE